MREVGDFAKPFPNLWKQVYFRCISASQDVSAAFEAHIRVSVPQLFSFACNLRHSCQQKSPKASYLCVALIQVGCVGSSCNCLCDSLPSSLSSFSPLRSLHFLVLLQLQVRVISLSVEYECILIFFPLLNII